MASVWLVVVLLLASSISTEAKRKRVKKCQKISVPTCASLGYQRTRFPNPFTNITTQALTNNLTKIYLPEFLKLNCTTTNSLPFLCSVYVPICTEKRSVIPPCREFCEKSVGQCPALAARFRIPWPEALDCSRYPSKKSGEKCIHKLKPRIKGEKGKKDKKKAKTDEKKCCHLGVFGAVKAQKCNLTSAMEGNSRFSKPLAVCNLMFKAKYNECCLKQLARIQQRKNKKQERKERRKGRKDKKKQEKVEKKKQGKQERRKQKQGQKQQKKKDRKQKKQNKKKNKNQKKMHGRGD